MTTPLNNVKLSYLDKSINDLVIALPFLTTYKEIILAILSCAILFIIFYQMYSGKCNLNVLKLLLIGLLILYSIIFMKI